MLSTLNEKNLAQRTWICLCNPADVRNVGGAIRAVANFGLAGLKVVRDEPFAEDDLFFYSSGALPKIEFTLYPSLSQALSGATHVVGTSRRPRDRFAPQWSTIQQLPTRLDDALHPHILFGNERTGLLKQELDRCQLLIEIETHERFPSMNLSHAVACVSYELSRVTSVSSSDHMEPEVLQALESDPMVEARFLDRVIEVSTRTGYPPGRSAEAFARRLSSLLRRANPKPEDYGVILGLLRELDRLHLKRSASQQGETMSMNEASNDGPK